MPRPQLDEKERRRRDLAAIHASSKQLGMDRDAYEAMLHRLTGQRSSAKLSAPLRAKVLDEMRRLGAAKPAVDTRRGKARPGEYPGAPHNMAQLPMMVSKIEAQLTDMSLSWAYADSIAKRMFGIARIAWVRNEDQLKAIIAALGVEQAKRGANLAIDRMVAELGMSERDLVLLTAKLPKTWRRNRKCLGAVADALEARLIKKHELEEVVQPTGGSES
ncbi:MAG: regulatory protein GemA [Dokdonella sp.]